MQKFIAGDHLVTKIDPLGLTQHHGLCIGNDEVIHLGKSGIVEQISLEAFAEGQPIRVIDIASCTATALERAHSQLGQRPYHLFHGNCEHFVTWCLTGEPSSEQISNSVHLSSQVIARSGLLGKTVSKAASTTAANIALLSTAAKMTGEYLNLPEPVNRLFGTPGDLIAKPIESVIQGGIKTIEDTADHIQTGEYLEAGKSLAQGIITTTVDSAILKPVEVVGKGIVAVGDIGRKVWDWIRY
jgi:hypothetical protein